MKKVKTTIGIGTMVILAIFATSCKDAKNAKEGEDGHHMEHSQGDGHMEGTTQDHTQMDHGNMDHQGAMGMSSSAIIADYLTLKDALVSDDEAGAAAAGVKLEGSLQGFDIGQFDGAQQSELSDILEDATEHAEHIAKSEIGHQREHFDVLSKDVVDLLAITGSDRTLYQAYCPMYNNNKGAFWLSASREIKNPYFGSEMLTCGEVQKEIK